MKPPKTVDEFIAANGEWKQSLMLLRELLQASGLTETVKWGAPVYVLGKKHIAGIGAFKAYAGIWFFQGVFLKDEAGKLVNAQEGKTKALRQWRFSSLAEIEENRELIAAYIQEAILNQQQGKEMKPEKKPLIIPPELAAVLKEDAELKAAFDELGLTKKRDYAEYIGEAKRAETKEKRLEKILPMIRAGIGLNDKYK